jgi:hypothetical protein
MTDVLRSFDAYTEQPLAEEVMTGLADSTVLYADYELIRGDAGIEARAADIDAWLLRETSFISARQTSQSAMNTPIRTTHETRIGRRPPRYCRAALYAAEIAPEHRLILDVKGCGMEPDDTPSPKANGLLTIPEAFHELAMERMTHAALAHDANRASTVGIYAIIDLGFVALFQGRRRDERAAIVVRQAQTRPEFQWGARCPGVEVARELLDIELTLRRYGLSASSCGAMRFVIERDGEPAILRDGRRLDLPAEQIVEICNRVGFQEAEVMIDGVNVQVSSGILESPSRTRIFDFGRYHLRSSFENVLYAAWDRDCESMRGEFVLPSERRYVQPNPRLSMAGAMDDPSWSALHDAFATQATPNRELVSSRLESFMARALSPLR